MTLLATTIFLLSPVNPDVHARHEQIQQPAIVRPLADERIPKSIWTQSSGNGRHLQSSLVFPDRDGSFDRTSLDSFDNFGLDVGCGFFGNGDTLSLFLNRRVSGSVNDDFEGAKSALLVNHPGATAIAEPVAQPGSATFASVFYANAKGGREGLWVADVSGWTLTFRATYDPQHQQSVLDAVSSLAAKALANAGKHLADCATAPAIVRDGTEITDKNRLASLSLIASVSEAVDDEKPVTAATDNWCAESPAGDEQIPLLYWRNIAMVGHAGHADRMSLMTMEEPPILVLNADPTASLIDEQSAKAGRTVYELTLKDRGVISVFGFFSGRPSLQIVNPISTDVFAGRRRAVTSFDPKSNTITIPSQ